MMFNSEHVLRTPIAEYRSMTWAVITLSAALYLLLSLGFVGPTYLQDEVGYLAKAALLAGKAVDAASSYHAGYSILLAPLFWLTSEIPKIWVGVVVLNTSLWVASLAMTRRLVPILCPGVHPLGVLAAVAGMATYPAWPTLTGYAFSSPLLITTYLLSLLLLNQVVNNGWHSSTALAICSGFTFWIHPTGLAIIAALTVTLATAAPSQKKINLLTRFLLITGSMILLYKGLIHPWINQAMTPHGFEPMTHYKSYTEVITRLLEPKVIGRSILRISGEFSYLIISTLGIFLLGAWTLIRSTHNAINTTTGVLGLFSLLSIAGVATMAAIQLETFDIANQIQHWQYGRYIDTVLPPILATGFAQMAGKHKNIRILIGAGVTLLFLAIAGWALDRWSHAIPDNNIITTPGFWPQYIQTKATFLNWYLLGYAGCIVACIYPRFTLFPAWLSAAFISLSSQLNWHQSTFETHSKPTDLPIILKENYQDGTCIGIDGNGAQQLSMQQSERLNLYSIHLTNMHYRRMHPEQWRQECDGPYLTYHPEVFASQPEITPFIKEMDSGLYLIERKQRLQTQPYRISKNSSTLMIGSIDDRNFFLKNKFIRNPDDLSRHTQVGKMSSGGLSSTGKQGYIFYGPYVPLPRGSYRLEVSTTTSSTETLILDIVSSHSQKVHWRNKICQTGCSAEAPVITHFTLNQDVELLEVRMHVRPTDSITVHNVKLLDEKYN